MAAPDGCSYFGQTTWPGQSCSEVSTRGQEGGKEQRGKKKQALKRDLEPAGLLILNLVNKRKLQNKIVTHSGHLGKGNQLPLGIRHKNFFWLLYGFIISAMPVFL